MKSNAIVFVSTIFVATCLSSAIATEPGNDQQQTTTPKLKASLEKPCTVKHSAWLNVTSRPVKKEELGRAQRFRGGLRLVKVQPEGLFARVGIKDGDILLGLDKWEILSQLGGEPIPCIRLIHSDGTDQQWF